jgi:tape measure domain-containing protein
MADVELRISADAGDASKEISGFRKEYVELVKSVEKPLRQVDALQKTTENAKAATAAYFDAKRRVDELKRAIEQAGQPVRELDRAYAQAQRTLASATREFDRQKTKVREQRAELKAAGVDVRNLAAEQQRLQGQLGSAIGMGRMDSQIKAATDAFGITQLRNLRTQLVALDTDYRRLTASANLSARERITAEIQYQAQVNKTRAAIRELEGGTAEVGGNLQAMYGRLAVVVAAAYSIERGSRAFFDVADAVVTMEDRLQAATQSQDEYDRSLARLEETSKRVRIPLAATSELFLNSVRPLREMGFSAAMTADMVAALSAGLVTSNVKGQQAEAVINQLSQGLQTGTIRGDAFNAMLRNAPTLIDALTKSLGVSRAELIRMANAGELTTDKFVTALSQQADGLLTLADNMRSTVGDARGTNTDSINKVIGAIDNLTGASEFAIKRLDQLSTALDKAAEGDGGGLADFFSDRLKFTGLFSGFSLWIEGFKALSDSAEESAETVISAEEEAASRSRELEEQSLAAKRAYAAEFNQISADLAVKFKNALDDQVAAQRKANSELGKARNAQLETEKRYQKALESLRTGPKGEPELIDAITLKARARMAQQAGDTETAKRQAQAALEVLDQLAQSGANTYGFEGFIKELYEIEKAADAVNVENAEKSFETARKKTQEWKKELEALKNFTIVPEISDQALADEAAKLRKWAQQIGLDVSLAPRVLPSNVSNTALGAGLSATQPSAIIDPKAKPAPAAAVPVPAKPLWVRDGNSFTDAVEVAAKPKWVQDGNSFGDAIPVEAKVVGIRKDGENSFTNLPPVDVELGIDEASATAAVQAVEGIAQVLRQKLQVPISVGTVTSGPQDAAGFSAGGWTGPGSKYQPAGVVHADEHVQPKEVVNEPGALPFLERIRRHGFRNTISELRARLATGQRGYAMGGLVAPSRPVPSIPPLAPVLQQQLNAGSGADQDWGSMVIDLGSGPAPIRMPRSTAEALRREALKRGSPGRAR